MSFHSVHFFSSMIRGFGAEQPSISPGLRMTTTEVLRTLHNPLMKTIHPLHGSPLPSRDCPSFCRRFVWPVFAHGKHCGVEKSCPGLYADDSALFRTFKVYVLYVLRFILVPGARRRQFKKILNISKSCKWLQIYMFSSSFRKAMGKPLVVRKKCQHWQPRGTVHYPTLEVGNFTFVRVKGTNLHPQKRFFKFWILCRCLHA